MIVDGVLGTNGLKDTIIELDSLNIMSLGHQQPSASKARLNHQAGGRRPSRHQRSDRAKALLTVLLLCFQDMFSQHISSKSTNKMSYLITCSA